jgi:hypothetical protein
MLLNVLFPLLKTTKKGEREKFEIQEPRTKGQAGEKKLKVKIILG